MDQVGEPRFDDRARAGIDAVHLQRVDVDSKHRVASRSEASGHDGPDVAQAVDIDSHQLLTAKTPSWRNGEMPTIPSRPSRCDAASTVSGPRTSEERQSVPPCSR